MSDSEARVFKTTRVEKIRERRIKQVERLRTEGKSFLSIALQLGVRESTVRHWFKQSKINNETSLRATVDRLKEELETKPFLDVGRGAEVLMGVATSKLRAASVLLKEEGYNLHVLTIPQLGTNKVSKLRVLTHGDKDWKDVRQAWVDGLVQKIESK